MGKGTIRELLALAGSACLLVACGTDDEGRTTSTSYTSAGLTQGDESSGSEGDGADQGDKFDVGEGETGSPDTEGDECSSVSQMAMQTKLPADIIIAVDNSGSMGFEAGAVQSNLNGFSNQIIQSGIDVHVVLVSSYPSNENGICVDPPLGGGGCPNADNNPPLFTHVNQKVESHDALVRILDRQGEWGPMMRPEAPKHLVIVSDDESNLGSGSFDNQFKALDPSYADYKLHAIVCLKNCEAAADIGDTYIDLANQTGGILGDLCDQNFQPVFDELSTEVIEGASLACEWEIPQPPDGMSFDPDKVNVEFDDGVNVTTIGRVDGPGECPNVIDGWYYDNPNDPVMILACPQTCQKIQGVDQATINIQFGCATVPAG